MLENGRQIVGLVGLPLVHLISSLFIVILCEGVVLGDFEMRLLTGLGLGVLLSGAVTSDYNRL